MKEIMDNVELMFSDEGITVLPSKTFYSKAEIKDIEASVKVLIPNIKNPFEEVINILKAQEFEKLLASEEIKL
jgi:hypothetical protein